MQAMYKEIINFATRHRHSDKLSFLFFLNYFEVCICVATTMVLSGVYL